MGEPPDIDRERGIGMVVGESTSHPLGACLGGVGDGVYGLGPQIESLHTHPAGQHLVVISGVGRTQEWSKPIQEIRPGDVVWCPPGVKHWHGAGPATAMTHLSVAGRGADGKNVNWMEKVTDEQYNGR